MAFFRSEKMSLWHMILHVDTAFDCLVELGYIGAVQFKNATDDYIPNMMYTYEIRNCVDLQHIIDFIVSELNDAGIEIEYFPNVDEDYKPKEADIPYITDQLKKYNKDLKLSTDNRNELQSRQHYLIEWYEVIMSSDTFLNENTRDSGDMNQLMYSESVFKELLHDDTQSELTSGNQLHYIAGTILVNKFYSFKVMIFRFFGFNVLVRHAPLSDFALKYNKKLNTERKYVVMLMNMSGSMRVKILKLCQAYHVTLFECPEYSETRVTRAQQMKEEVEYIAQVLKETDKMRNNLLDLVNSELYIWKVNIKKSLMVYVLMNKLHVFDHTDEKTYLHAEVWIPENNVDDVRSALMRGSPANDSNQFEPLLLRQKNSIDDEEPTYFRSNRFTRGFQNLIDAYGIADYRELNPAPYTIITFPFLFAVMFGDIGHGIIVALFAYALIHKEKNLEESVRSAKKENEIFNILFAGRYIILLMGLFSIYTGFCYNDIFSKTFNPFGSAWYARYNAKTLEAKEIDLTLNPNRKSHYRGTPYWFGIDPIWDIAGESSITTFNSLKMKLAIIMGVSQMMFGLILSAVNAVYFKKYEDLLLVVMPSLVFMICLFCYLVFLVFFKWLVYGGHKQTPRNSACAPSVLIMFIDMVLFKDSVVVPDGCSRQMFGFQRILQYILVIVAFLTIPILLAGKPIFLMYRQKKLQNTRSSYDRQELGEGTLSQVRTSLKYSLEYEDDPVLSRKTKPDTVSEIVTFDMSEVWIHSAIHCIETVLGSVSHTASYLRLWALSLAHDQLSTVLWHMVFEMALKTESAIVRPILIIVMFFVWAVLTLAILVSMEGLSAFLHTLRLHWVEFQSKFYSGAGEYFAPFKFERSNFRS